MENQTHGVPNVTPKVRGIQDPTMKVIVVCGDAFIIRDRIN